MLTPPVTDRYFADRCIISSWVVSLALTMPETLP
ncbi:hypothetical protein AC1_1737, partial [Clostridium perfringens B str. ATCC 3626]